MHALVVPLVAVAALLVAEPAFAFRCKGKIVSEGDPQAKVLHYCGDPVSVQQRTIWRSGVPTGWTGRRLLLESEGARIYRGEELLIHDRSVVEVLVEEWTYNLGPHKLMRVVRFEDGVVVDVATRGYGFHD
jgi:hypothetical protein